MILSTLGMGGAEAIFLIVSWLLLIVALITAIYLMKSWVKGRSQSELALAQLNDEVRRLKERIADLEKDRG